MKKNGLLACVLAAFFAQAANSKPLEGKFDISWLPPSFRDGVNLILAWDIASKSFKTPPRFDRFEAFFRRHHVLAMIQDKRLIGFVSYDADQDHNENRNELNIRFLGVHPEFRNQGIGTRLITELKKKLGHVHLDHGQITARVPARPFRAENFMVGNDFHRENAYSNEMVYDHSQDPLPNAQVRSFAKSKENVLGEAKVGYLDPHDIQNAMKIEDQVREDHATIEIIAGKLQQRNTIGLTAKIGNKVVGYAVIKYLKRGLLVPHFAVDPDYQRQGIGQKLLQAIKDRRAHSTNGQKIEFFVREGNTAALAFLRKNGLIDAETFPNYFKRTGEDAIVMEGETQKKVETASQTPPPSEQEFANHIQPQKPKPHDPMIVAGANLRSKFMGYTMGALTFTAAGLTGWYLPHGAIVPLVGAFMGTKMGKDMAESPKDHIGWAQATVEKGQKRLRLRAAATGLGKGVGAAACYSAFQLLASGAVHALFSTLR